MDRPQLDPELRAIADEAMADIRAGKIGPEEIEVWWERRRENEQTADYLGRVLDEAGLPGLARAARAAHYDDYFAPAEVADGLETLRLVRDLRRARSKAPDPAKLDVIEAAVRNGEFDATKAESDRWAASEEGQRSVRDLVPVRKVGRNEPCPCSSGRKYKYCHGA